MPYFQSVLSFPHSFMYCTSRVLIKTKCDGFKPRPGAELKRDTVQPWNRIRLLKSGRYYPASTWPVCVPPLCVTQSKSLTLSSYWQWSPINPVQVPNRPVRPLQQQQCVSPSLGGLLEIFHDGLQVHAWSRVELCVEKISHCLFKWGESSNRKQADPFNKMIKSFKSFKNLELLWGPDRRQYPT